MKIIGITGTNGSGKGTVVDYLVKNKGFLHFSGRNLLSKLLAEEGLELNRENLINKGNQLREKYGSSALASLLYEEAIKIGKNCVIESIRTVGEIELLKNKGNFILLAVEADPKIRYERVMERGEATDKVSFEKFLEQEKMEMENNDPNKQNLRACIQRANYRVENNGSVEKLYSQIENLIF